MVPIAYPTTAISNMDNQLSLFSLAQDYSTALLGVTFKELRPFFRSHHEITVYGTPKVFYLTCSGNPILNGQNPIPLLHPVSQFTLILISKSTPTSPQHLLCFIFSDSSFVRNFLSNIIFTLQP